MFFAGSRSEEFAIRSFPCANGAIVLLISPLDSPPWKK